jgi:hypothetical protein
MARRGEQIGEVTSARYSSRPEMNFGYRQRQIEHSEVGTDLEIDTPSEGTPVRWSRGRS